MNVFLRFLFFFLFLRNENIVDHDGKIILVQALSICTGIEVLQSSANAFLDLDDFC